jgi:RNA polymerase sigma factor (sigma-70 family)
MVETKETIDQNESKLIGAANLTPIVERFYGPLYRFAVRLTKSESDAADLVQETFFTLIQHLHRIRDLSRIKCWLFTTLRRNFLMEVRHRAKHREVEFLPDVHGFQPLEHLGRAQRPEGPFATRRIISNRFTALLCEELIV